MDKIDVHKKWEFIEVDTQKLKEAEPPFKNHEKNMWGVKLTKKVTVVTFDWFDTEEEAKDFYDKNKG